MPLIVASPAFNDGDFIPTRYTREGRNISPPLLVTAIPDKAACMAIMLENEENGNDHWLMYNIRPEEELEENYRNGKFLYNFQGRKTYEGPEATSTTNNFTLRVFALKELLKSERIEDRADLEHEMENKILAKGELTFRYRKSEELTHK